MTQTHRLYHELAGWYHLVDPPADHGEEAARYLAAFQRGATPPVRRLLELGSGAGHNATHLKHHLACTLADVSEPMLARSRALNPECAHVRGDMRTLRLDRTFDAVLVHDAVVYMTTEAELAAAIRTAFVHTRPGGAAVFAPDDTLEAFRERTELIEGDDGTRVLRGVAWTWDPDPCDHTCTVDYALLLREGRRSRLVHDRHLEGLFPRATWMRLLSDVGFRPVRLERAVGRSEIEEIFLCRRSPARGTRQRGSVTLEAPARPGGGSCGAPPTTAGGSASDRARGRS